ncbi:STAS domain-containing protein [Streptomyces sp. ODS28]|uniref:STAS domain-containing protein n=1 Tax=Streptomyces sp. ODS28 TaxID=3136688 RepID=UPI0031E72B4F
MGLRVAERGGRLIVTMPGELDIANAEAVRQELRSLCRERLGAAGPHRVSGVVVDWSAAPWLTCAGVAVLEDFREQLEAYGVPVGLVAGRCLPRKVLRLVGMDGMLPVYDSLAAALEADAGAAGGGRGAGPGT